MNTKKKLKIVNPNKFGLTGRTTIGADNKKNYYIIKNIKSRIIMKDGARILSYADAIQESTQKQITVETCAPVCSKTKTYLWNHRVLIKTTNQNTTNEK